MTMSNIEGQTVYSADGRELGTVKEIRGDEIKVDAPMQPDFWVRAGQLQQSGGRLVVMDEVDRYEQTTETRTTAHHTGAEARETGGDLRHDNDRRGEHTGEDHHLQLREERLRVGTEREQAGEVTLGKRVVERTETVEVPVREERVIVERRPVNERTTGEITDTDETIEVEVERERVVAEKEAVVTEEVGVRKEVTQRTERVQGTVRKEELVVEGEGDLVEGGRNANMPRQDTYQQERTRQ